MRSFIGIDFSRELKISIEGLQQDLKAYASSGRWKREENFHVTLKFLAEVDEKRIKSIDEKMETLCSQKKGFGLRIKEMGIFQGKGSIRVLWLGLGGGMDKLYHLQASIEMEMQSLGFEAEKRRYTPHITIGQDVVFNRDFIDIKKLADFNSFPEIWVNSVCLFKSEQVGGKRVYTPVSEYKLKALTD